MNARLRPRSSQPAGRSRGTFKRQCSASTSARQAEDLSQPSTWLHVTLLSVRLIKDAISIFITGVIDSLRFRDFLYLARSNDAFRRLLLRCTLLNGLFLLLALFSFTWCLCRQLLPIAILHLSADSSPASADEWGSLCLRLSQAVIVSPLYILALPINTIWYKELASLAFNHLQNLSRHPTEHSNNLRTSRNVVRAIALPLSQLIYRYALTILFTLMVSISHWLLGSFFSHVHLALLTAYYAIEYRWDQLDRSTEARIYNFETCWLYFAGFGFISALVMRIFAIQASIWGSVFIAFIFPWQMVNAIRAQPLAMQSSSAALRDLSLIADRAIKRRATDLFTNTARRQLTRNTGPAVKRCLRTLLRQLLSLAFLICARQCLSWLKHLPLLSVLTLILDTLALRCRHGRSADEARLGDDFAHESFELVDEAKEHRVTEIRVVRSAQRRRVSSVSQHRRRAAAQLVDHADRKLCDLLLEQRGQLINRLLR